MMTTGFLHGNRLWLARSIWISIVGLTSFVVVQVFILSLNNPSTLAPQQMDILNSWGWTTEFYRLFESIRFVAVYAVFLSIGLLIFFKRSSSLIAIVTSAITVVVSSNLLLVLPIYITRARDGQIFPDIIIGSVLLSFGLVCSGGMLYFIPDGHFYPRWTKWLLLVWAGIIITLVGLFISGVLEHLAIVNVLIVPFIGVGVAAQIYRYRRIMNLVQRQQMKWILAGMLPIFCFFLIYRLLLPTFIPALTDTASVPYLYYHVIVRTLWFVTMLIIPFTVMVSILRYRLYDVDIVLNRSIVYGSVTIVLTVFLVAGIVLLQYGFERITGQEQSTIAVVLTTLAIAALFNPLRLRLQKVADQQFPNPLTNFKPHTQVEIKTGKLSGQTFGAYQVIEPLGRGGMAEVYRGKHLTLDRDVAIKVMHDQFTVEAEFKQRFEREARVVAALKHPNIVQLYDFGSDNDRHYMVLEYVRGIDLSHHLKACERMSLEEVLPVLKNIASALDYAHQQGLIHRDVKASNVMLETHAGHTRAVLMDFGIAKLTSTDNLTKTGAVGTLDYMAPEQIMHPKEIDYRVDLYALGVLAFQMLTGKLPFESENYGAVIFAHIQQPPPDPRLYAPELPEHVVAALFRALAKNRDDRFQSAGEFVVALA